MPGSRRAVPMQRPVAEFSRVRATVLHARDYLPRAEPGSRRLALPGKPPLGCFVGRQSRWAGSGIPRRARVSGTHRRASLTARKPGKRFSRGRSPRLTRTLPHVEEDILAKRSIAVISGSSLALVFASISFLVFRNESDC